MSTYRILLYYKFVKIENPDVFAREHLDFCNSLKLLGRIIVAPEGINGTLSGTIQQTDAYIALMRHDHRFADMEFKIDGSEGHVFKKLSVKARKEIVTFGLDTIDPNDLTGKYIEPKEFYLAMQEPEAIIIDARNDYEYDIGHFQKAIRPNVEAFKEFPEWVRKNLSELKDKKILTYCTGGIRCEKFSGFLLKEGFKDVCQLHGGIVNYSKDPDVRGRLFDGKCYVFDERMAVRANFTAEEKLISKCYYCSTITDRFVNCAHLDCHVRFFLCESCEKTHRRSCSKACEDAEHHEYVGL
ncbi:rhodanese-related sulfurtransferase [bacterium]|nr:MAG: rhodanese-related sulfurtransferase [bacterium]